MRHNLLSRDNILQNGGSEQYAMHFAKRTPLSCYVFPLYASIFNSAFLYSAGE